MNTDKLMELERRWREDGKRLFDDPSSETLNELGRGLLHCADELAAALRAEQAVGDEQRARELLQSDDFAHGIAFIKKHRNVLLRLAGSVSEGFVVERTIEALGTARQSEGVLVPREPTEAMLSAMAECYDPTWGYPNASIGKEWAQKSYAAMLAAAPGGEGEG